MKVTLNNEQKQALKNQHGTIHDGRVRDRIKAVIHASYGWSPEEIADALLIHESTVRQPNKLKPENGGSQSDLSDHQTQELLQHLTENTYHHSHEIVAYVLEHYQVRYSVPGMNKWLHHNGFSYKQSTGTPHKFDEDKQQAFVDSYETLKASCGKEESIVFIDAVHPTLSTKISHSWIRTGQDKNLKTTGNRSRLNLIGGLNLSDIGATVVGHYESINRENVVRFLYKLRERYPLENKPYYLPPYNLNLNPIERLCLGIMFTSKANETSR